MTPERYQRIKSIFFDALELPHGARGALLERACGSDGELRHEVELLLSAEGEAASGIHSLLSADDVECIQRAIDDLRPSPTVASGGFSGSDSGADAPTIISGTQEVSLRERAGSDIGPYHLEKLIGEGGFGSVFMAQQERPVRRRVALKIIKLGMDTRQVVARFEQERQALALMDHPGIAKVFDAGTTATGRPYFVMELCSGDPLAAFCDQHKLSVRERLDLFIDVCAAVQHAHTKGIIHRDLKPNNVLVAMQDGRPAPRVIDFGIAKATASKIVDATVVTEHRQFIGTPEYMSPEQADGGVDIDTRTDIYSLGVILYELLTGTTPFERSSLRRASFAEIQRVIREVDPPRPSARLSQNSSTVSGIALLRRTEPRRLNIAIRGELDWIVMKALEKERGRRYETATALAADIRRYLSHEPVQAAPPSGAYRLRKFIRRNRGLVTAASAIGISLMLGVVAFAWQARIAGEQRDRAVAAETEARQRVEELKTVSDFQASMLEGVNPSAIGIQLTSDVLERLKKALAQSDLPETERRETWSRFAAEWSRINSTDIATRVIDNAILTASARMIDAKFGEQPRIMARLQQVLADGYAQVGLSNSALPLQVSAVDISRHELGDDDPDTLHSLGNYAGLLIMRGEIAEAEPVVRDTLDRRRRVLGEWDSQTLAAYNMLAGLLVQQGKLADAEKMVRKMVDERTGRLGENDPDTLAALDTLATILRESGRLAEAEPYQRTAIERRRTAMSGDQPATALGLNNMGTLLYSQAKYEEAARYFREAYEMHRRLRGELHPDTLQARGNLAITLSVMGKTAEGESLCREIVQLESDTLGRDHPLTLSAMSNLASVLTEPGALPEAEALVREAMEKRVRLYGRDHPTSIVSANVLGNILRRQGKSADAEVVLHSALESCRRALPPASNDRLTVEVNYATLLSDLQRPLDAIPILVEAVEEGRKALGGTHPIVASAVMNLSQLFSQEGRFEELAALAAASEADARQYFTGKSEAALGTLLARLGKARGKLGLFAAGEPKLLEAYQILERAGEPGDPARGSCADALAEFYEGWGAADPTPEHKQAAKEWRERATKQQAVEKSAESATK